MVNYFRLFIGLYSEVLVKLLLLNSFASFILGLVQALTYFKNPSLSFAYAIQIIHT